MYLSRASFVSGLYPPATGAAENHAPMTKDTVTFAQILMEHGWDTGFVGKWHLNGEAHPGWSNDTQPVFGFNSTKYMYVFVRRMVCCLFGWKSPRL